MVSHLSTAEVITIGNELLIGKIVNTNSTWLCKRLTFLGFEVRRVVVLPDDEKEIAQGVKEAAKRGADVLLMTGGLGPTFDDKTSRALSIALKRKWVINPKALEMIKKKYSERGLEVTEHRLKMAKMPEGAEPIPNPIGTAPGILVKLGKMLIIALPGVPEEMKAMFERHVEPLLKTLISGRIFLDTQLKCVGLPESTIAPIIEKVMEYFPSIYIKSHPLGCESGKPIVLIHLYTSGEKREITEKVLLDAKEMLKRELIELKGKVMEI